LSAAISYNVYGLGEVAFVRWLVCRKAILPNPCYKLAAVVKDKAHLKTKNFFN
jgi:hypothetical protein